MASEISQMSDSSIVIIQGTVGLYTVATRCHTCFAVTLKYTEDSSLTIIRHSLVEAFIAETYVQLVATETRCYATAGCVPVES